MNPVGGQLVPGRIDPGTPPNLRQPLTVIGKYRHAANIRLDRGFFEQGLQYLDIAGGHAIFGCRRQLPGNRYRTGTQRLIEIVDFRGDELEQQQHANNGHRHHGQADDTTPYPQ